MAGRAGEAARCSCEQGWGGSACEKACPGLSEDGTFCSGVGSCTREGLCRCDPGYFGDKCEGECPGGAENACYGNGECGIKGACRCFEGWTGVSCRRRLGPRGMGLVQRMQGAWKGAAVMLPESWSMSPGMAEVGIENSGGASGAKALDAILADSSPPGMAAKEQMASARFDSESQTLQLKVGEQVSTGTFYLWDPSEVQRGNNGGGAEVQGNQLAYADVVVTAGPMAGTVRGLVYSNGRGKAVVVLSMPERERPESIPGGFSEQVLMLVLSTARADPLSPWPWPAVEGRSSGMQTVASSGASGASGASGGREGGVQMQSGGGREGGGAGGMEGVAEVQNLAGDREHAPSDAGVEEQAGGGGGEDRGGQQGGEEGGGAQGEEQQGDAGHREEAGKAGVDGGPDSDDVAQRQEQEQEDRKSVV